MTIDAHRGGGGKGGRGVWNSTPPRQIFEKLVNKNAIKRKIGGPPWQFLLNPLTPPRNFGKNIPYPLPWIFNPCASMFVTGKGETELNYFYLICRLWFNNKSYLKHTNCLFTCFLTDAWYRVWADIVAKVW